MLSSTSGTANRIDNNHFVDIKSHQEIVSYIDGYVPMLSDVQTGGTQAVYLSNGGDNIALFGGGQLFVPLSSPRKRRLNSSVIPSSLQITLINRRSIKLCHNYGQIVVPSHHCTAFRTISNKSRSNACFDSHLTSRHVGRRSSRIVN